LRRRLVVVAVSIVGGVGYHPSRIEKVFDLMPTGVAVRAADPFVSFPGSPVIGDDATISNRIVWVTFPAGQRRIAFRVSLRVHASGGDIRYGDCGTEKHGAHRNNRCDRLASFGCCCFPPLHYKVRLGGSVVTD